tara:strand:- start:990 stop:6557 length:5568 start_codon:yes stop_codon:yes gene_type:complete
MTTPNRDRDIWARFRPALQQAGRTLGQAAGDFAQLPGVKQVIGAVAPVVTAASEKVVNPFMSQVIAGSPLQGITKDPDRRWEAFKTPDGDVSWGAIVQANPISLLARGTMGLAREHIPGLHDFRIAPQGTMKAQRLRAEEARREAELGRQLTGRELRLMEQEMYALPKHFRGAIQEAPFFALPSTGAIRAASAAARGGAALSAAGRLGRAAPLARGGLRAAEVALKPLEVAETAAAKAIAAPFKGAARGVGAMSSTARGAMAGAARGVRAGTPGKSTIPRRVFERETDLAADIKRPGSSDIRYTVGVDDTRPPKVSSRFIRDEAKAMYKRDNNISMNDAFDRSQSKNYGDWAEKLFKEELAVQQAPKISDLSLRAFRNMRQGWSKGRVPLESGANIVARDIEGIERVIRSGYIKTAAARQAMGKHGKALAKKALGEGHTKTIERVLAERLSRFPLHRADFYVYMYEKLGDATFGLRTFEDYGAWKAVHAGANFDKNYLSEELAAKAKKYVPLADKLVRSIGNAVNRGGALFMNFHRKDLQPVLQKFSFENKPDGFNQSSIIDDIEKYVQAMGWLNLKKLGRTTTTKGVGKDWRPKHFDRVKAEELGVDPSKTDGVYGIDHAYMDVTEDMLTEWGDMTSANFAKYSDAEKDAILEGAEKIADVYKHDRLRLFKEGILSQEEFDLFSREYKWYNPVEYAEGKDTGGLMKAGRRLEDRNVIHNSVFELAEKANFSAFPPTGEAMAHRLIQTQIKLNKNQVTKAFVDLGIPQEMGLRDVSDQFVKYRVYLKRGRGKGFWDKGAKDGFVDLSQADIEKMFPNYRQWGPVKPGQSVGHLENVSRQIKTGPNAGQYKTEKLRQVGKGKARYNVDVTQRVDKIYTNPAYDEKLNSGYLSFFRNGERVVYGSQDGGVVPKQLWDMINGREGLGLRGHKAMIPALKAANGFVRSMYTEQNPVFAVRNGIIDMFTVQMKAGVGMHKSGARVMRSLWSATTGAEDRMKELIAESGGWDNRFYNADKNIARVEQEIKKAGHKAHVLTGTDQAKLRKSLEKITEDNLKSKIKTIIPTFGTAIEQAPRLAVSEKSLRKQIGDAELNRILKLSRKEFEKEMNEDWVRVFDAKGNRIRNPQSTGKGFSQAMEFQKAASNGIEATLDFSRGGQLIRNMNQYFLFFNAAMEAVKLPFRTLGINLHPVIRPVNYAGRVRNPGDPVYEWGTTSEQIKRYLTLGMADRGVTGRSFDVVAGGPKTAALRMGAAVSTYMVLQNVWNKQFKYNGTSMYYDVPPYIRYNSFVMMMDSEKDENGDYIIDPRTGRPKPEYIVIPHKLREWNLLAQSVTYFDEATDEEVPMDKQRWFNEFKKSFSPIEGRFLVPEPIDIAWEELTNRDHYRGTDIIDPEYQQLPPNEQYNRYTSLSARKVAGIFDKAEFPEFVDDVVSSPERLDHLVENVFGTLGRESLRMADAAIIFSRELRRLEPRPMKEWVKEYREDMDPTERKEFMVSLDEEEYAEFQKELKETELQTPFLAVLKRSFLPSRGGGIREIQRKETEKAFPEIDPKQNYKAGIQAAKDRQSLKFKQDKDDQALNNWRTNSAGTQLTPSEWIDSHENKWDLYARDIEKLAEAFPGSIYAQPAEVRDAYYQAYHTAAGKMKDQRDGADFLIAGYRAIQRPSGDPGSSDWSEYYRARDEFVVNIKKASESAGDNLYNEFLRRLEANYTETEKAYYKAMKTISPYWGAGQDVREFYTPQSHPQYYQGSGISIDDIQALWGIYLKASVHKKEAMRFAQDKDPRKRNYVPNAGNHPALLKDMIKKRSDMRRRMILNDQIANNGKSVLESALVFWYGGTYYKYPVTKEGKAFWKQLYLR